MEARSIPVTIKLFPLKLSNAPINWVGVSCVIPGFIVIGVCCLKFGSNANENGEGDIRSILPNNLTFVSHPGEGLDCIEDVTFPDCIDWVIKGLIGLIALVIICEPLIGLQRMVNEAHPRLGLDALLPERYFA